MVKLFTLEYKKQYVEMVLDGKHSITQMCKMMRLAAAISRRTAMHYSKT